MASNMSKFNQRNPAVKRIVQEIKEMQRETSPDCIADALEDDIFEWHFVIRGPPDTEFEGGIYHGRILLPAEYPFKPPSFMMLTPNGRFQTGVKICLSISSHHPEHWQPSWSVRTALTALIAFMPTPGQGALGSIDFTKEERQQLAVKSQSEMPKFGSAARQKVIQEMHQRMLDLQAASVAARSSSPSVVPASDAAALQSDVPGASEDGKSDQSSSRSSQGSKQQQQQQSSLSPSGDPAVLSDTDSSDQHLLPAAGSPNTTAVKSMGTAAAALQQQQQQQLDRTLPLGVEGPQWQQQQQQQLLHLQRGRAPSWAGDSPAGDRGLTFLAVVLAVAIAGMLFKKVMTAMAGYRLMV